MGCCVSSGKSFNSSDKFDRYSAAAAAISDNGNREPPSSMEEETVKEVLSETPAPKPPPPRTHPPEFDETQKPVGGEIKEVDEIEKKISVIPTNVAAEQISEVSEISGLSESLSTTNYTDKMDDGEEVHQRVNRSSPVKTPINQSIVPKRDMLPNRTLNQRSDQSPGRRNGAIGSTRLVQSKDIGSGLGRRGVRAEPHRRDAGENSGRKSRSPAAARLDGGASRSGLGRTPSVRKSGNSPGRAAMGPMDSPQKVAEEPNLIEGKLTPHGESLENPLVSLECFIFL